MTAQLTINATEHLHAIAIEAGQPDQTKVKYSEGILFVEDVTQGALTSAFNTIKSTTDAVDLQRAKEVAVGLIEGATGVARESLLTIAPGQDLTYLKKEIDAEKFKVDGYPEVDIADYPWIQAEANARSDTGQQVTDLILAQAAAWVVLGVAIEEERIRGKVQVDQQLSVTGVNNALDQAKLAIGNAKNR